MKNQHSFRRSIFALFMTLFTLTGILAGSVSSRAASFSLVVLTQYRATLSVGEEFYLGAVSTSGEFPTFHSSSTRIASVNTYGRVTAKQPGTCRITAKADGGEASCKVTVRKTTVTLGTRQLSMENGETRRLPVSVSSGSTPTFTSNKTSVAVVDSDGWITACKPGSAVISVKADTTTVTCRVTVDKPTITLSHTRLNLFRCQQAQLSATVSSGLAPTWKTNRSSIASVSDTGLVTALKHGTATITATADGVSKTCTVKVTTPVIQLSDQSITMKVGTKRKIGFSVSSGNDPEIKSSKPGVVQVTQSGQLKAKKVGTSVISFTEDGARATCKVKVTKK